MMKKLLRVLKIIVIGLALLVIGLRLSLTPAVRTIANKKLPPALGTEVSVGDLRFGFLRGYAGLSGLRIGQPRGFDAEDKDLFSLGSLEAKVRPSSLRAGVLEVERVEAKDLYVHVIRGRDGRLNVEQLGAGQKVKPEEKRPVKPAKKREKEEVARPIRIKHFAVRNGTIKYTDYSLGEAPVRVNLADLDFEVNDLLMDAAADASAVPPAVVSLVSRLKQEGLPDGRLGLFARVGPVGGAVPVANASARLVGFDLTPFQRFVPPATLTLLGGRGLDVAADIGLKADLLEVNGAIEMAGGSRFPFRVGGTPQEPEFDTSSILFGTFGRLGGVVSGTTGDAMETGKAAAEAVVEGAGALAGGALRTIGGLGRTVKSTAQAGLKGDLKKAGSSLVGGIGSAAKQASGAVAEAVGATQEGLAGSAAALTGKAALDTWRQETDKRWETAWADARKQVAESPFPPARSGAKP